MGKIPSKSLMQIPENCLLVIFGASGDLTKRKLIPALYSLYQLELLPKKFKVLGVSRSELSNEDFHKKCKEFLVQHKDKGCHTIDEFLNLCEYLPINTSDSQDYLKLKKRMSEIETEIGTEGNTIYYLSTPPSLYGVIPDILAEHGLNQQDNGWKRLIVEKPFGVDLQSAQELNAQLLQNYNEHQIYRIDHYLGKETVQNLLVFRFANDFFEPLWNNRHIDYVEVTGAESLGVEDRGGYYDKAGAMRDMLQNHLLQVVAMVAMEAPTNFDAPSVRNETIKVIQGMRPLTEDFQERVVFGQYTASRINGKSIKGYRQEKGVPQNSRTETYVGLETYIDNLRWSGVPFYIRTGKHLPTRVTEIVLHFKQNAYPLLGLKNEDKMVQNQLIIRIQPNEGILLKFGMKAPGAGFKVQNVNMDFSYADLADTHVPEAYERLLLDCMMGDPTLYARGDMVEACWKFVDPIMKHWESGEGKIYGYQAGTWGPKEADHLLAKRNNEWRMPCKNLINDGDYCEL